MAKGLSRSIQDSITKKCLNGLPLHGISPPISHNQFVDDTLMMGSPIVMEAHAFLSLLQNLCDSSGLDFNKNKS
jgi:hypothetical protein